MNEEMKKEQEKFMASLESKMNEVIDGRVKGLMTSDEAAKQIKDALAGATDEQAKVVKELTDSVADLNDKIAKMEQKGIDVQTPLSNFDKKLNEMFDSPKFKEFQDGLSRRSGSFGGFSLKDIVSLTGNYTGNVLISEQQDKVVSKFANKKLHMRDILTTIQGDPNYPQLAYAEVSAIDRNARYVSENGTLPESMVSWKENNVSTKRIGTHIKLSKRMLKSRVYVRSYVLAMLPEAVRMAEDWNILFGDGTGDNFEGIANKAGVESVEAIVGTAVSTGVAGAIISAKKYNNGKAALIEFKDAHPEILDGMKITLAAATTNTGLNATHDVIKVNDRQILVAVAMTGDEADAAKMTFTVKNSAFKSIESPNSLDVIKTAFAVMNYAQYTPTAIILNPITVNEIEAEKDTSGRNLGLVVDANGVKSIAGRPIVEYSGIPAGKYLLGDFSINGASLVDYTSLSLEWAEDVNTKLTNRIDLIAQEEVIFPIYNPWAFAYGDLAALKTAITKS